MLCLPLVRRPAGIAAIIRPFGPAVYVVRPQDCRPHLWPRGPAAHSALSSRAGC